MNESWKFWFADPGRDSYFRYVELEWVNRWAQVASWGQSVLFHVLTGLEFALRPRYALMCWRARGVGREAGKPQQSC